MFARRITVGLEAHRLLDTILLVDMFYLNAKINHCLIHHKSLHDSERNFSVYTCININDVLSTCI